MSIVLLAFVVLRRRAESEIAVLKWEEVAAIKCLPAPLSAKSDASSNPSDMVEHAP